MEKVLFSYTYQLTMAPILLAGAVDCFFDKQAKKQTNSHNRSYVCAAVQLCATTHTSFIIVEEDAWKLVEVSIAIYSLRI
jgi:hypothetical protein